MWLLNLEKVNFPYHLPGEMFTLLRRTAFDSIKHDFNMIIEEYGFWEKLTEKDKSCIVRELFGEYVRELQPLLLGCEEAFVSNFIVSFAFRRCFAGQIIQYANDECSEMYVMWQG